MTPFYPRKGSACGIATHFVQRLHGLLSLEIEELEPHETALNKGCGALVAPKLRQDSAALPAYHGRIYADMAVTT